ncbi:GGDEF domain protein [compost metagenome]
MGELISRLLNELNALSRVVSTDVSVSVGCAVYPDQGKALNDLLKIADRKMYRDKRGKITNAKDV